MKAKSQSIRDLFIAIFLGVLSFLLIVGPKPLNPSYIAWLSFGDPLQHYLGWSFYRWDAWNFPLGLNLRYGLDVGSSIVYSDSIPPFAIFFKLINTILPEVFQYFGMWLLVCFVLQSWVSLKLLRLITPNRILQTLGVSLFLFFPPMLWRVGMHAALCAHFLILAAIYLNLNSASPGSRWKWFCLMVLACSIHFYLFAIVAILFFANSLNQLYVLRNRKLSSVLLEYAILVLVIAVVMWQCGYFVLSPSAKMEGGYGLFQFNLWSMFNPRGWSYFIPSLPMLDHSYEGYCYLGLGIISLILIAIVSVATNGISIQPYIKRHFVLSIAVFLLLIFAITNNVQVGTYQFSFPMPDKVLQVATILRSSARMVWPLLYLSLLFSIFIIIRGYSARNAVFILGACLMLQVVDTSAGWIPLRKNLMHGKASNLDMPFHSQIWESFAKHYKKVIYMPLVCYQQQPGWSAVTRYAAQYHLASTSAYLARIDCERVGQVNDQFKVDSAAGKFDTSALYIFSDWKLNPGAPIFSYNKNVDLLAQVDGFIVLAPGWNAANKQVDPNQAAVIELEQYVPLIRKGEIISFQKKGRGAKEFLLSGWGFPEDWGIWSVGGEARLVFPKPADPVSILKMRISPFVAANHPVQRIAIFVNGQFFKNQELIGMRDHELTIPITRESFGDSSVAIDLHLLNPVSPRAIDGISSDTRALGVGLKSAVFH